MSDQLSELIVKTAGMGRTAGMGEKPVLVIIDMQNYMLGDKREPIEESIKKYPSSCGLAAWDAADKIKILAATFRSLGLPVIYTQQSLKPDGSNAGPFKLKREFLYGQQNWLIEGTHGWEIAPLLAPKSGDVIIQKTRPSAFYKTGIEVILSSLGADTLIVTGGSVAACVRATVFDSASNDYKTVVVSDGVCDRIERSKEVNLYDMGRQFADVMSTDEIIAHLKTQFVKE